MCRLEERLFCTSMTGRKKTIGDWKISSSQVIEKYQIKDLPITWKSNKKTGMTRAIMGEWLIELDGKKENSAVFRQRRVASSRITPNKCKHYFSASQQKLCLPAGSRCNSSFTTAIIFYQTWTVLNQHLNFKKYIFWRHCTSPKRHDKRSIQKQY